MNKIKRVFDHRFQPWGIELREVDLEVGKRGSIHESGWTIGYRVGEEDGRKFLEYFASHRMTNDSLHRIFEDGKQEPVGYCQEFYSLDEPGAEEAYYDHNRRFYELVKARGLSAFERGEDGSEN